MGFGRSIRRAVSSVARPVAKVVSPVTAVKAVIKPAISAVKKPLQNVVKNPTKLLNPLTAIGSLAPRGMRDYAYTLTPAGVPSINNSKIKMLATIGYTTAAAVGVGTGAGLVKAGLSSQLAAGAKVSAVVSPVVAKFMSKPQEVSSGEQISPESYYSEQNVTTEQSATARVKETVKKFWSNGTGYPPFRKVS